MPGSILPHGFQASHFLGSFTCGKIASGGALMASERVTVYSEGRVATMMTKTTMTTTRPIRILTSFDFMEFLAQSRFDTTVNQGWPQNNSQNSSTFGPGRLGAYQQKLNLPPWHPRPETAPFR